jgi:flagellar biosynthesis protein FlhF
MKIKRYVATDMRQAMRLVRESLGADAVILSSRRGSEGVEIIAAIDYDEAAIHDSAAESEPVLPVPATTQAEGATASPMVAAHIDNFTDTVTRLLRGKQAPAVRQSVAAQSDAMVEANPRAALPRAVAAEASTAPARAVPTQPAATMIQATPAIASVQQELGALRHMLEAQLASLAWNDFSRRQPLRKQILSELHQMGVEADVAARLMTTLPDTLSAEQTRYLPLGLLSRHLTVSDDDLLAGSGVIALVGPTGVGKTTTVAKLAARRVAQRGPQGIALVSTDGFRIGAQDQLFHYGRMLRVPVYSAVDAESLREVLGRLRDHDFVLIDTPGFGYRDVRIQELLRVLGDASFGVRNALVLAANAQAVVLDCVIGAYAALRARDCILTKLDETPQPASAFSVLMRHKLPLNYVTDGQRVPEDLQRADAHKLVLRAARMRGNAAPSEIDETLMAERFGRVALAQA